MPPGFGFGWWAKEQYTWDSEKEQATFLETMTTAQLAQRERPDLSSGIEGQCNRAVARCTYRPSSAGCWLFDGPSAYLVKLTDLFDTFRNEFTAREIVDFYLGLPIYLKKRRHGTDSKKQRVDKIEGARDDVVSISVCAAKDLMIAAGMADKGMPSSAAAVQNAARGLRQAIMTMEASWIGSSSFVQFEASSVLPDFILRRMPGYTTGRLATVRVMLFCPGVIRAAGAAGEKVEAICFRTTADVTAKFQLTHNGTPVNGFYCDRCARNNQSSWETPPACRLLYMWWAGMPAAAPPLHLVLMDIGNQQLPARGSSSADPPTLPKNLEEMEGSLTGKELRDRGSHSNITRIRLTGAKAQALWEYLCALGTRYGGDGQRLPGAPRSSVG